LWWEGGFLGNSKTDYEAKQQAKARPHWIAGVGIDAEAVGSSAMFSVKTRSQ
jgi:hypothetical protein